MNNLQIYYENTQQPWGRLFYKTIWNQLSFVKDMNVLDFGSGFGFTANFLAMQNNVIAIEPNLEMCEMRIQENKYQQITAGLEQLQNFPDNHFDFIVCHNVLEYVDNKEDYIKAFYRVLNKPGIISLVKHNSFGRIMQRVIFENNLDLAIRELEFQSSVSQNFGEIKYYTKEDIIKWVEHYSFSIDNIWGIRTFFGLVQNNKIKYDELWQEKMLAIEEKVCNIDAFKDIAFFNHIILSK